MEEEEKEADKEVEEEEREAEEADVGSLFLEAHARQNVTDEDMEIGEVPDGERVCSSLSVLSSCRHFLCLRR